jgi:hypothetical protein
VIVFSNAWPLDMESMMRVFIDEQSPVGALTTEQPEDDHGDMLEGMYAPGCDSLEP